MIYNKYNDNELLYLISINNEDALDLLIKKYYPLIKNRIKKFNIKEYNREDYFQECLITLVKVVDKFRDDKNGIFTLYLDKAIQDRIRKLLKKEQNYFYNVTFIENLDDVIEEKVTSQNYNLYESNSFGFSDFENDVYEKYYLNQETPRKISVDLLCEEKQIYNAINRIKIKITRNEPKKNILFDSDKLKKIKLSELEKEILYYYNEGYKVSKIAFVMECDERRVLNALSRVKYKLKRK